MVVFPNCKINIGLRITSKREDGYHNLETVFVPIPIRDAMEVITSPGQGEMIKFSQSGIAVDGNLAENLCIKAYRLLQNDFPQLPAVKLHLHKAIPIGAGLGGGSADAAITLKLISEKYHLNLSEHQLINYSLQLGSDCPFFIVNKPSYATGRGEILTAINLNLSRYQVVIINPGIHINTGWAFSELKKYREAGVTATGEKLLSELIMQPIENWKDTISNDFELPVFSLYPELQDIKNDLYKNGAVYAAMSGSGSTMYGIFGQGIISLPGMPPGYFIKTVPLL